MQTATKTQIENVPEQLPGAVSLPEAVSEDPRHRQAERLRLLWAHRWLFLQAIGIGLAASALVALTIPRRYTSITQLMPPDSQSTSTMAMMAAFAAKGGGLGSVAGDLLGLKSTGALFIGLLRSQTSQERLIQQFDLNRVYEARLMMDARKRLDENTSIAEDRKSGIITISVTDRDPRRAAALANAYVDELNSLVVDVSTSSAHRERVFLEERLKVVKQDLDDASNELAQFSSKNSTIDIKEEGQAIVGAAANLAGQLIAAQSQLEGLRQIYTDNNPRVQSFNARVAELRRQLEKIGGAKQSTSKTAEGVSQATGMPYPSLRNLPLLGVKYSDYYRRAKIQETVYELLTEQYELAKVQEAKETPSVKVLDPAKVPEKKSGPARRLIALSGAFLGFALCIAWVLGRAYWQETGSTDPRKLFIDELVGSFRLSPSLDARKRWGSRVQQSWSRFGNGRSSDAR
jgi:uncharacterized protein involved in exopolysaccharide biosynthesis